MEIKNLKKAAQRIKKAVKDQETIIISSDTDLDGTSAAIILKEAISSLGGKISLVYFPDRTKEGYGLNKTSLEIFKKYLPALLILLDSGIGNIKEVHLAKKAGFEIIILDHHEILDSLPEADIIVDPKQEGDNHPFKGLAAAGIVFKVASYLMGPKITPHLRRDFVELASLATIADMMPRKDDNEDLIREGLAFLEGSWRPGLKAFMKNAQTKELGDINLKVSKLISLLNIRDVEDSFPASWRLLTARSEKEAEGLIKTLFKKSKLRKKKIEKMLKDIEKKIVKKEEPVIFEGDKSFDSILMSSAASALSRKYSKPAFLYKKMEKESVGTVRSLNGLNSVSLMKRCSKYLLTYGGHPQASGFRVKNSKLEEFKGCLIKEINNI